MLRRRVTGTIALEKTNPRGQLELGFVETSEGVITYEYAVLVTSLTHDAVAIA